MSSDPWADKPEREECPLLIPDPDKFSYPVYDAEKMDAFHEKLKGKITQLHECLGEYESKEWCGHCIVDSKCAQITMHIIELKKKGDVLDFLFSEKGVRTENLMKLQIWREKAELWDQYAIYDNDNEPKIFVKDLITAYEKLEAVKNILNEATGGEWHIKTINKQSWVKYESAMRYYHAVCSSLKILEAEDNDS